MRLGVISNRLSRRNRRGSPDTGALDLIHRPIAGLEGLSEALDDFAAAEVGVIAINGGDGTASGVMTELLAKPRFAALPALAVIAGGTLNMSAANIGLQGKPESALARLAQRLAAGDIAASVHQRPVVGAIREPGSRPLCGLFFANVAFYRAIDYCVTHITPNSPSPRLATAITFAMMLGRVLFRRGDPMTKPERLEVALDGGSAEDLQVLFTLVTTLDRLVLGTRPFWGREAGALKSTTLTAPPEGLLRRLPRALYGGEERDLPSDSYRSHNVDRMTIAPGGPFALDGELYETAPGQTLELRAMGPLSFLRC
ncbi:MAG: diacylglycerol kinase family protein [Pseudomonadota bacterium]